MLEARPLTGRANWPGLAWPGIPEHKNPTPAKSEPPSRNSTPSFPLGLGTTGCQVGAGGDSSGYVGSCTQQPLSRLSCESAPGLARPWESGSVEKLSAREREKQWGGRGRDKMATGWLFSDMGALLLLRAMALETKAQRGDVICGQSHGQ